MNDTEFLGWILIAAGLGSAIGDGIQTGSAAFGSPAVAIFTWTLGIIGLICLFISRSPKESS